MVGMNFVSRVPNQPFLNEPFYIVWAFSGATFTRAFTSIASVISEVLSSSGSYVSAYPAGSVATGTWNIWGLAVKGTAGTFNNTNTIKIRNSEIADPAKTVYDILRTNVGTTYASTNFSTGWFSGTSVKPQITVTRGGWTTETYNVGDTQRWHVVTLFVDTWVPDNSPASAFFGATGYKNALTLLDAEVKRLIDANNKAPSNKLVHMMIVGSVPLDEVLDNRRVFRTRHTLRIKWSESIA